MIRYKHLQTLILLIDRPSIYESLSTRLRTKSLQPDKCISTNLSISFFLFHKKTIPSASSYSTIDFPTNSPASSSSTIVFVTNPSYSYYFKKNTNQPVRFLLLQDFFSDNPSYYSSCTSFPTSCMYFSTNSYSYSYIVFLLTRILHLSYILQLSLNILTCGYPLK